MKHPFMSPRLSGKLLILTIAFVMLAELVLFVPSAAIFRQDWIQDRIDRASLVTVALDSNPQARLSGDAMPSEQRIALTEKFVSDTGVVMLAAKQNGMTQLILGMAPASPKYVEIIDARNFGRPLFRDAFRSFFGNDEGCLRILAQPALDRHETFELLIEQKTLKMAMRDYFKRILLLSLVIAIITGGLIYQAMAVLIIRPITKLAQEVAEFQDDPEKRHNRVLTHRKDEIGDLHRAFFDMKQSVRASFKQRERLATLGLAVAKINHDLRNVLTSAQLVSDRLAMDKEERVANMGERLTRAIDRGVKLTAEVLNFSQSKEDPPALQNARIKVLIEEAANDVLGTFGSGIRKVRFVNKIPDALSASIDPDHTYRIFHNLFRNAGQAMAEIKDDAAHRVLSVSAEIIENIIQIRVHDTGPGMPPRAQDNLFKAFAASSGRGNTGLGLTISKELARDQGGDLVLENTGPGGTSFRVSLPLSDATG